MTRGGYERLPMYAPSSRQRHSPRSTSFTSATTYHLNFESHDSITLPQTYRSRNHSQQSRFQFKIRPYWRRKSRPGYRCGWGSTAMIFAGTIQPAPRTSNAYVPPDERTQYHTYWRKRSRHWMLKSFFAHSTFPPRRLVLWSNGNLGPNDILTSYLTRFPESFALRVVDIRALAHGTDLEGSPLLVQKDKKAWVDGDLTKSTSRFNGALMRFKQHSPYLCEAFHIMATTAAPRPGSTDWGSLLYLKLWRALVAGGCPAFKILPFCFSDARSCRLDNRLPDPFVADDSSGREPHGYGKLDKALQKIFGVHLHNQWEKAYPAGGWVERLLLKGYDSRLRDK
ncbi:glycosyltransferase family 32 protein [Mycena olivaceomarginata]|nr:glycosyltransferase family 32 protein [Mycena olivaceomarginata]